MNGGERIADVLHRQGVRTLFTLCGGHISPILVGANKRGIRVVDVRDEKNAVFAADATARLTGVPGVAAVTAGPGVSNTITAVKNAQLAHSPLILLGGATATVLRNRGALQDIDQLALISPHVKWATSVTRVRDLVPVLEKAFRVALEGLPGPVFVELPVDLLYDESTVREMYGAKAASDVKTVPDFAIQGYLRMHLLRVFGGSSSHHPEGRIRVAPPAPDAKDVERACALLKRAKKPVFVLGSQTTLRTQELARTVEALESLGVPVYLSGMARGLLGRKHPLWYRHSRGEALKQADFVLLGGVPNDFRLNYGLQINRRAKLVTVNLSEDEARKNRRPELAAVCDPSSFLWALSDAAVGELGGRWEDHHNVLRSRDDARELKIADQAREPATLINPLFACRAIEEVLDQDSVLVADGGDFVATASYIVAPRSPLSWLDPGVFGTLGVGAGFAAGAKIARPESEVWILYGDGSVGFTISEFDTFVRHKLAVIAVVGNDAGWTQIARDQVVLLEDDVGTVLARTDYHKVAEGFGARGILVERQADLPAALREAKAIARAGTPVLVNIHLDKSEFRKGSISMQATRDRGATPPGVYSVEMSAILDNLSAHRSLWTWVSFVSVAMFVGSLLLIPWLAARAPRDYFVRPASTHQGSVGVVAKVLRNLLGALLLVVGLLLLVLPGQGLLMVLLGVSLMDIPGKHALIQRIVQKPPVWRALTYLRERAHKEPFERPGDPP